jgi:hypothetical protein
MERTAWLFSMVFALAGCGPVPDDPPPEPTDDPFTDAIGRALQPRDPYERTDSLETALDLATAGEANPATQCGSGGRLGDAAAAFGEIDARLVIAIFQQLDCADLGDTLADAARGLWLSRSGVTRALALHAYGRGSEEGHWPVGDALALSEELEASPSEEVRLAAYLVVYEHATPSVAAITLERALHDESPIVRSGLPSVEVVDVPE